MVVPKKDYMRKFFKNIPKKFHNSKDFQLVLVYLKLN